jgi:hypothetical protein
VKISADRISYGVVLCSLAAYLIENGVIKKLIPSYPVILFVGQHALN